MYYYDIIASFEIDLTEKPGGEANFAIAPWSSSYSVSKWYRRLQDLWL